MRSIHRQFQCSPHLIAIHGTVTARVHPAGAMALPFSQPASDFTVGDIAALVARVAGPTGTVELRAGTAEEIAKAESDIGQRNRFIGIAFARGDGIAESGDQKIPHHDLGRRLLDASVRCGDADAGDGRLAVTHAQPHFGAAIGRDILRRDRAVVEIPDTARAGRHHAGQRRADGVIRRRQVRFAHAVALAGFGQPAVAVEAKAIDHVARPSASVVALLKPCLGGQNAVAAIRRQMVLEIGFAAEQAEAVLHLPFDTQGQAAVRLRRNGYGSAQRKHGG